MEKKKKKTELKIRSINCSKDKIRYEFEQRSAKQGTLANKDPFWIDYHLVGNLSHFWLQKMFSSKKKSKRKELQNYFKNGKYFGKQFPMNRTEQLNGSGSERGDRMCI